MSDSDLVRALLLAIQQVGHNLDRIATALERKPAVPPSPWWMSTDPPPPHHP
jgi:hypothetical protein